MSSLMEIRPQVAERVRIVADRPPGDGDRVLYWMRTAVRGHENPALDAALELAAAHGRSILVYHALSERYPYASDRLHRFVLEGARDVQQELANRGVPYVFHLERPGQRGKTLLDLARRAAHVVTEEMPVEPLRTWTDALASRVESPVWSVDTACLAPLPRLDRARDRAFAFRKAAAGLWEERIHREWADAPAPADASLPADLPFDPLDLQRIELDRLIAECDIDHTVAPVPHTTGGSRAGYRRWEAFRASGLRSYARRRNDALADGVSRMSPYLHFGHVAPQRIAREAAAVGGSGADKYLDELLVWRELAYHWCFHRSVHDTPAALPDWARETLEKHESDARDWRDGDALSRGRTGDALWDACQRSLVVHGELHNNVRMTWGKAIPLWSRDTQEALDRLIDLNHRFALDGRDPASYGGLLWCLGQFDRPFPPERPILGQVRPRSTAQHARRLDVEAYRARVERPAAGSTPCAVVDGSGLAAALAARTLEDHGWIVRRTGGGDGLRESGAGGSAADDTPFDVPDHEPLRHRLEAMCEAGWLKRHGGGYVVCGGAATLARRLDAGMPLEGGRDRADAVLGLGSALDDLPAIEAAIRLDRRVQAEEGLLERLRRGAAAAGRVLGDERWFREA